MCVCVCVCVSVNERKRERVCVRKRERVCVCVCVYNGQLIEGTIELIKLSPFMEQVYVEIINYDKVL